MPAPTSLHPSEQTLRAFGNGQLDSAYVEAISAHLDGCEACLQKVVGLSSDGFLDAFRQARSTAGPGPQVAETAPARSRAATRASLPPTEAMAPPPGDEIPAELANYPDYRILRELGRGGMGVVYLAHNDLMRRDEVLKIMGLHIIARPGVMDRFLGEIRAVAGLRHPNIVAAYTAFRGGESLVFAMEYVEGLDLARMVRARGPMPVANACSYVQQAALGLQHAHERGLVHRDIKPGNLMLSRHGDRAVIKVLDFGLAKAGRENKVIPLSLGDAPPMGREATLTLAGQMLGTPDFIAPEQIDDARSADIRADIYSLGCTLYYLLSGSPPFQGATLYDVLQAQHSVDARLLNLVRPEVPSELAALVAKMMAKEPKRRFQTPDEVAKSLGPFFRRRAQVAMAPGQSVPPVDAPATSLSMAGSTQVGRGSATAPAPAATPLSTRHQDRPEEMWKSLIDFGETEGSQPALAVATEPVRKRPHWFWPDVAGLVGLVGILLLAAITYRIATDKGELIVETDDPSIDVSVKQGGNQVVIMDLQTRKQIELRSGQYEMELVGDKSGLSLSTDRFTLRRGDKVIVSVRREAPVQAPGAPPTSERVAGAVAKPLGEVASDAFPGEPVGELRRFATSSDWTPRLAFFPDGRRLLASGSRTTIVDVTTGRMTPLIPEGLGGWSVALSRDGRRAAAGLGRVDNTWDL